MRKMMKAGVVAAMIAMLAGCAGMSQNETTGTILGGLGGAVAGSQFGKGRGNKAMTAIGAVIGAAAGAQIGRSMDQKSRERQAETAVTALERGEVGTAIRWDNPDNAGAPAHGSTTVTKTGSNAQGQACREYHQEVWIGGKKEQAYGTACRDATGAWKIVES